MHVVLLTADREQAWRRYVETSVCGSLAHRLEWRNVVMHTYGHRPCYLMALDGERVAGVLPLFVIKSRLFGRFLLTAPYLSHGGLLADSQEGADVLLQAAHQQALEHQASYVEVRSLQKVGHALQAKDKYCTLLLPLGADPAELWKRFQGRARRAVRKAQKLGVQVERGHHLLDAFAEVMSRRMRDLGTPFHRSPFYRQITCEFSQQAEIFAASHQGRYIGGLLLLTAGAVLHWPYGGALTQARHLAPMSLLIWEAIRYACERRLSVFDLGRSQWNAGTFVFKQQWGAEPAPIFYEYETLRQGSVPDMDPTNPKFRLAIALWRRLPLRVTQVLGPLIIRDIA